MELRRKKAEDTRLRKEVGKGQYRALEKESITGSFDLRVFYLFSKGGNFKGSLSGGYP